MPEWSAAATFYQSCCTNEQACEADSSASVLQTQATASVSLSLLLYSSGLLFWFLGDTGMNVNSENTINPRELRERYSD